MIRFRSSKPKLRNANTAKPRVIFADHDECFEGIGMFRRAVGEAICDAIEEIQAQPPQSHLILHEAGEW